MYEYMESLPKMVLWLVCAREFESLWHLLFSFFPIHNILSLFKFLYFKPSAFENSHKAL